LLSCLTLLAGASSLRELKDSGVEAVVSIAYAAFVVLPILSCMFVVISERSKMFQDKCGVCMKRSREAVSKFSSNSKADGGRDSMNLPMGQLGQDKPGARAASFKHPLADAGASV